MKLVSARLSVTLLLAAGLWLAPVQTKADSICHTPASSFNASLAVELGVCDSSGNLMVKTTTGGSTSSPQYTRIQDGTTTQLAEVSNVFAQADGQGAQPGTVVTSANITGFNGSTWDRLRTVAGITGAAAPTGLSATGICNGASATANCATVSSSVLYVTMGGATATACAAAANCVVKASSGRLVRLTVTTVGTTGIVTCYDNASAASGTVLGGINATNGAALFYSAEFDAPAVNGVYCVSATAGPAFTAQSY